MKQGRYNTAWAQEIAGRARAHLTGAARDWEAACEEEACTRLRKAGLYALKGVIAANGSPAVHGRDLTELWNRAEALDGGINAPRDDWKLKGLSRYADAARETLVSARRGARIYRGVRRTIEALVEHAEKGRCAGRPGRSRAVARMARRHVPGDTAVTVSGPTTARHPSVRRPSAAPGSSPSPCPAR